MRPRRASFATDYIAETVHVYARVLAGERDDPGSNEEIRWATDVLSEYFSVVDRTDPVIEAARSTFLATVAGGVVAGERRAIPYQRALGTPVTFPAFMELCRQRRSVRWYLDKPIPRDAVDRALEAAAQSPSACNRQPFFFRIFDDKASVQKVAAIPLGTRGFGRQLPAVAVLVGRLRAYPLARDRHAIYVDGGLAAMSFMYALECEGLASCPLNWADQEPQESMMRSALRLEADERVIMLIAFGWPDPDGMVAYSAKRPLDQLRAYEACL